MTRPLQCPSCGNDRVGSNDIVQCVARGAWIEDGNGGREFHAEGWTEVFWDTQRTQEDECFCEACAWQGNPDQLVE